MDTYLYIILAALLMVVLAALIWCWLSEDDKQKALRWLRTHLFPWLLKWLKVKVDEAEQALGSGTGELKLKMVYTAFTLRFKWLATIMPFSLFSALVDDALEALSNELEKVE